jgi:hypothetical protein
MDQQAFGAFVMDISKPQRCWVHVEQVGDELVLRWRAKWFAAAGSFAFLLLFTAFCVFVIAHATRAPTLGDILFWIFLIGMNIPGACYLLQRHVRQLSMEQVVIFRELKSFLRISIRTWLMDQNPCETSHFLAIGVLTQRWSTRTCPAG